MTRSYKFPKAFTKNEKKYVHTILGFSFLSSDKHFCHWEICEILFQIRGLDPCCSSRMSRLTLSSYFAGQAVRISTPQHPRKNTLNACIDRQVSVPVTPSLLSFAVFLAAFLPFCPYPPPHSLHTHTLHSRLRTLSVSCSCGVGLCCLQWAIHTLRPLIMTDMILCVYACVFRVCMWVNQCVRVRGSVREVHTQCTCVYVYMIRTCNTYTHKNTSHPPTLRARLWKLSFPC